MAKKNDNTILWVAGIGLAGYFFWQWKQTQAPANNTTANASTGILALPPAPAINNSLPVANAAVVTSSPGPVVNNVTNLVAAAVNTQNIPTLKPNQTLALNPDGTLVSDKKTGLPLVFDGPMTGIKMPVMNGAGDYMCGEIL